MSDIERTEFNLPEGVDAAHTTQRNSDVDATAHSEEHDIERSLRPKSLEEFIGQPKVREQLSREPYPYPRLRLRRTPASIFDYDFDDIEVVGYDPHPTIKAEVSV